MSLLLCALGALAGFACAEQHVFSVDGERTLLNSQPILVAGLRCSDALISDEATEELIANLDTFASYGVNTVSVYVRGSRFGEVKGYNADASLNPTYMARLGRIIEAGDARGMEMAPCGGAGAAFTEETTCPPQSDWHWHC